MQIYAVTMFEGFLVHFRNVMSVSRFSANKASSHALRWRRTLSHEHEPNLRGEGG